MRVREAGFTLVEALIAVVIAAILVAIAMLPAGGVRDSWAVVNARNGYIWLSARAKMVAVERGSTARLIIDPATDRAWVVHSTSDTITTLNFVDEFSADVTTATGDSIRVCYSSRGFALESCNTGGLPIVITFSRGTKQVQARVQPLGLVESL
ncbi:MAG: type II secretion system protein [Gemmatimonadetes bacterium]|nr:type II secretion system protein [Gemmatimonadota bacterium]